MNGVPTYGAVIVGGGFYGARAALMLRGMGSRVLLVEREAELLSRASLRNQARVHNGYHYPRSILTSLRSRLNYARFLDEYSECVNRTFPHYYAIGRGASKVTAAQFAEFCRRIEAPLTPAPDAVASLFDSSRIEAAFEVQECAFDAIRLRARMMRDLAAAGVEVMLSTEAAKVQTHAGETIVTLRDASGETRTVGTELVLNCTYSRLNVLLHASGAAIIPMKHELTEMALIDPPKQMMGAAVTVMDGPFFSMMPYPSTGYFTLSHVRYTPHCHWMDEWTDGRVGEWADRRPDALTRPTRFAHMMSDAARYLPSMRAARYVSSIFEVKTVMPRSEQDDSRPILLRRCPEHPAMLSVLGAKIDSAYDVEDALAAELNLAASTRQLAHASSRP